MRRHFETFELQTPTPFDGGALFAFLGARAIPGVEQPTDRGLVRALPGDDGTGIVVTVELDPARPVLVVTASGADRTLRSRIAGLLDLATDGAAADRALAADELLAPSVRRRPGLRVPGGWDGFELSVRAVLGQQVSVRGACTLAGRIVARHGTPVEDGTWRLFPDARTLRRGNLSGLGLTTAKIAAIRALAHATEEGALDLRPGADAATARVALQAIRGIGPWTAEYLAMRALRDPDAFPQTDLILKRALTAIGGPRRAERWRPWRAYAAIRLWNGAITEEA